MSTSSAQPTYSITSGSIDISSLDTITLTGSAYSPTGAYGSAGTITISNGSYSIGSGTSTTFTSGAGVGSEYIWNIPEEFINSFPSFDRIQQMCEEYPGLKIAFEKFKTTYYLVKDDFDTPVDKRAKP